MSTRWTRFAPYAKPEAGGLLAVLGLSVLAVALEALVPWPLKLIVDHVLSGEPLPHALAWLGELPGAGTAAGMLAWLAAGVFLIFLAVRTVQLVKAVLQVTVNSRVKLGLARAIFDHLQALSLTYHRRARTGDLVHRVTSDSDCLATLTTGALLPAAMAVVSLALFFAIMWQLDSMLALVALIAAGPMAVLMRAFGPKMSERAYAQQQSEGEVWSVAEQALVAIPVVQAFGREADEGRRFDRVAGRTIAAYMGTMTTQLQFKFGIDASQAVGVALITLIGGLHVQQGTLTVGALIVFLSYLASLYAPLNTLAYMSATLAAAGASARRVLEVLDSAERVPEPRSPRHFETAPAPGASGRVVLEDIVFGYERGKPVLHVGRLEVQPGQTLALVGATGAGKSTLAALVPRLFDPWQGRVTMDGLDLRDVPVAEIRARVGLVLQDPHLLPISVADNIAYGRGDASRDEIVAAAKAANADEFVRALPDGYNTIIGERGLTLSGGQRQRLSIARALLKNAPVLILDEPTSALDATSEDAVMTALRRLMQGRTTIIIAHRLSTVRHADRIVVLERGRIAETGRHGELLEARGLYYGFWSAQRGAPRERAG